MPAESPQMDEEYMRRALGLAAKGLGRTAPNPAVGAVVVSGGEVVGEGWHRRAGEAHAEVVALEAAGEKARGGTIYVTLEPCSHFGRTPPCTDAIVAAGLRRVVYACGDCDDRCAGRADAILTQAGLEVTPRVLEQEAVALNEAYIKHKRSGLPFVTLKMACSLDGKTVSVSAEERWVTGEAAREHVHRLRDRNDAVLVGIGTVLADDPQLTTRLPGGCGRDPLRVVADSAARTPPEAKVIGEAEAAPCLIAVSRRAPEARVAALREAGAEVVALGDCRVDLQALMATLGSRGVMGLLLEGGGSLAAAALQAGIVDKIVFFYAPRLFGGRATPTAVDGDCLPQPPVVDIRHIERVGQDLMVEGYLCSRD